ncbi:MAG: NAD-dependent epimerase/dehydratase family protein [Actinobacteria bacterium]|nr:NAD-dependent epimerase/dehydratase family protein [Actinomycetota bacterium]
MLLAEGYQVVGIDNLTAGTLENIPEGVEFHKLDIRSDDVAGHFKGCDAVFHLAAKNCLIDCMENPLDTADVNVRGTVQVLEVTRTAGVTRFIYADTSAEYEGVTKFPTPVDEVAPIGTYAASKRAGWHFCDSYRQLYGMDLTTLRYFNVYGPAQDYRRVVPPVMSAFIIKMLEGKPPSIYGTGEKRRDFVYVNDVNRFHLLCLEDKRTIGKVYNIGSGINYSIREVFDRIEALLKTGLQPVYEPDLPGEAEVNLADISESQKLGWEPEIDLDEGLKRSIAYIRERVMVK